MAVSADQIIKSIRQKSYSPIYFLHGEEAYFIDQICEEIEKGVLSESEKAFNQITLYGKEIDFKMVMDNARQFPMMSERRVVIIKEAQEMRSIADLATYAAQPSMQTILVICYKYKKLDKRKKFAKELAKHALIFESKKLYDNQLPDWIRGQVTAQGMTIKPDALYLMVEYLGADLNKIVKEVQKLKIFLKDQKEIDLLAVQNNIGISKDYNVFELQKAIGSKNVAKIARIFKYFEDNAKSHPIQLVISSLFQYTQKLMLTKVNASLGDRDLQGVLGLSSSYFLRDYKSAVANYSLAQMNHMILALRKADHASKGIGVKNNKVGAIYKEFLATLLFK